MPLYLYNNCDAYHILHLFNAVGKFLLLVYLDFCNTLQEESLGRQAINQVIYVERIFLIGLEESAAD